jgi:hypothetical protein
MSTRPKNLAVLASRAVLFGDSHSNAVQRAAERRIAKDRPVPAAIHRLLKTHWKSGQVVGDTSFEQFLEIIRPMDEDDLVFSMIGGNQHAVFSTIQHPQRFDFLEPDAAPDFDENAQILPYRMIEAHFEDGLRRGDGKSLKSLREATSARVVHIMAPPPKADNAYIEEYHETVFAREGIAAQGVSSPALRMKFWKLQTRILEMLCRELGIEVMMPPAGACDADGFLAREYYSKDATHANPAYGELVLAEIERWVGDGASVRAEA